ncbi:hypothetical protein D3873_04340 [Paenisporosarcina cavernae]|uniref:Uncharacterized protein n=1 Tax=Paenisporosarcina cavernae TaxID=2320858 RepID=A0A385YRM5_9BACL|nr:hypothetical protein D3873_04340 [Paenisporosarcina cavernae]
MRFNPISYISVDIVLNFILTSQRSSGKDVLSAREALLSAQKAYQLARMSLLSHIASKNMMTKRKARS